MAGFKTSKNLSTSRDEYVKYYAGLRGVDFSSDHTEVADSRLAYLVNMYKDYKSGEGASVETIPGFRSIARFGSIFGIHVGDRHVYVHTGRSLYFVGYIDGGRVMDISDGYTMEWTEDLYVEYGNYIPTDMLPFPVSCLESVTLDGEVRDWYFDGVEDGSPALIFDSRLHAGELKFTFKAFCDDMARRESVSFFFQNRLYILDSEHYISIDEFGYKSDVVRDAYIPTTHIGIDLNETDVEKRELWEHEHRNILTPKYKNSFVPDGKLCEFPLMWGVDEGETDESPYEGVRFPKNFDVYLSGKRIPWAIKTDPIGMGIEEVPEGYSTAIVSLSEDGVVKLVNPPPAPTVPGDATLVITASKKTTTISGITSSDDDVGSIITGCTIATLFDNRVFLSGNPDYPRHIFWCNVNKDTGYPDARYFPIVNYELEGISDSPVTAMIPVADTLMVLKRECTQEGSVIFHTPTDTGDSLYPRIYPSTQGLPGRGCLGAACNFLDDPVFISRLGLEAMGQLSARYERAIEHRSSLIDSRLLLCDLEHASIAEWEGYLLILTDGKIFMADSRQTYTHESGVMQYEWYYLENIGVWNGDFPEYVYAKIPGTVEYGGELSTLLGGRELHEATAVRDELGNARDLIGQAANPNGEQISEHTFKDYRVLYTRELPERDELGRETGNTLVYYVEPSGAKIGGTFDPAVKLCVIGEELYFATVGGVLCKFYFDKRDKESGLIPVEYYNFDGHAIFSGCATKMDNCGIPHLTKNTVKRSTVVKTRTRTHSNAKIKVRTNKKAFSQVGRIINGSETFEDVSFTDFTFNVDEKNLFSVNEKEKKWVEKQIFIYSDEYCRPFALNYLAYRYNVAGKYKE